MAEEEESNKAKKLNEFKEPVTSIGNSWIICRSQSHDGRIYYFNTLTGKAVWNLSNSEITKAQLHMMAIAGQPGTSTGDCPEPMEPPVDTPNCSSNRDGVQNDNSPRIDNKQIINNQYSKPYLVPPFVNPQCQCASLNYMNDLSLNVVPAPVCNPNIWAVRPTHQVFMAPPVSPLTNQLQPDLPVKNEAVPLSSRFQIINQFVNNADSHSQGIHKNHLRCSPSFPVRRPQSLFTRKFQNKMYNDLRDMLSSRRKDFIRVDNETEFQESHINLGNNIYDNSEITENDLYPSDIDDEWLKKNATGEDKNLRLYISSTWRLAGGGAKTPCWFIIANTAVLLNHMSFLSSVINSDEQVRLFTPAVVLKQLRSATGAGAARLSQRARRAVRFAVHHMHKVPAYLKNLQDDTITSCCLKLIQQNYHVVLLIKDKNELQSQAMNRNIPIFTINEFKEHLTRRSCALRTNSRENLTIRVLSSNDANSERLPKDHASSCQSTGESFSVECSVEKTENNIHEMNSIASKEIETQTDQINKDEINSIRSKANEIQTDQMTSSVKRTANASVQTDFEIKLAKSPKSTSKSLNSNDFVKTLKIDHTVHINTVVESSKNSKEELKVAPKKIKLNRNQSTAIVKPVAKSTIKWRKRRANVAQTTLMTPTVDAVKHHEHTQQGNCPPKLSTNDVIFPQSDDAVDYGKNTEISDENVVLPLLNETVTNEETGTLSGISNSVGSQSIFKDSKAAIMEEFKDNEKGEIVMFEVAGDLMDEYLIKRRDEWVSRFVQIMEEALTQILQQESHFMDSTIPPPWSIQEATVCIKQIFMNNSKVVFAADKLAAVLLQISDSRGKIYAELKPSDFMQMYSYGVYLISALQDVLIESEDLQIARKTLSKLLEDIRDPNLDVLHNVFIDDDKVEKPVNRIEEVTDVGDNMVLDSKETTQMEDTQDIPVPSNKSSPIKYNLRSNKVQKKDAVVSIIQTINDDDSFFTTLRLQKNNISSQNGTLTSSLSLQKSKQNGNEDTSGNDVKKIEPKIIRSFSICPQMEKILQSKHDDEYFAEDNNFSGNELYLKVNDYTTEDIEEKFSRSKSSRSDDIDVDTFLKWFMERTTYPIHRILIEVHKFCNETCVDLNSKGKLHRNYKTKLIEKTIEVNARMEILCKCLKRIMHRKNTKSKFRCMLKELGYNDIAISNSQVEEYVAVIEKYILQANLLFDSVNLLAAAVKDKEIIIM